MYGHKYTAEEQKFMAGYVPGHSYREIQKAFKKNLDGKFLLGRLVVISITTT